MESNLRGILEKQLDVFLTEKSLRVHVAYFNQLKEIGFFTSIEDALFGALFQRLMTSCATIKISRGSKITGVEIQAIKEICKNRSADIKSKISLAAKL